jgi:phosphoribosyl-AMP cyclohydrolase
MDRGAFVENLVFNEQGLIPVVVQQVDTREVLMVAWMNACLLYTSDAADD